MSVRPSVCLAVCHTCDPRLNLQYRIFCASPARMCVRFFDTKFLSTEFRGSPRIREFSRTAPVKRNNLTSTITRKRCKIGHKSVLFIRRKSHYGDLGRLNCAILCYFLYSSFWQSTASNLLKLEACCQRQCSPGSLV